MVGATPLVPGLRRPACSQCCARRLGVSLEAFCRQLENLDLLPRGTFDSLKERGLNQKAVQQVLGVEDEPVGLEGTRLLLLAAEAAEQRIYSEGAAR